MTDPLHSFDDFTRRVRSRLDAGRTEYGDASFSASPDRLLDEIQQELLDVCGWSFILNQRIEGMSNHLGLADPLIDLGRRFAANFWRRVDRTGLCWPWRGKLVRDGYGQVRLPDGTMLGAHRLAWALANGAAPDPDLHILHECDNPPCCNPAHLRQGTDADNARDREDRGRGGQDKRRGVHHPRAKLTHDQVRELRRLRDEGATLAELGRRFGMTYQGARSVALRETWSHVTDSPEPALASAGDQKRASEALRPSDGPSESGQ